MDEITQQLAKGWETLPAILQDFILEGSWEDKLASISERQHLTPEQAYVLKVEVALVLFGLESPSDFPDNVKEALLGIEAEEIISNVRKEIFINIEQELNKLNAQLDAQDKIMNEEIKKLPPDLQRAIDSGETDRIIEDLGKKYKLHIDQLGELNAVIWKTLLGLESSVNFVKNLEESLKIDRTTAENIAREANEEIFLKIRESLKQIEENKHTPKPEDLLKEIENHASPTQSPEKASIFERKLAETVNLKPVENIIITPDAPATPPAPKPIVHVDPYHERIE